MKRMKARITKPQTMYYGEVYISGIWKRVTMACFTMWGAKLELNRWRQKNYPKEMEL